LFTTQRKIYATGYESDSKWVWRGGAVVLHIFGFSRYDTPINCPEIFNALKIIRSRNIEHKLDRQRDCNSYVFF
jgi:hypothetical protein